MKRQLSIYALANAKVLKVENRILTKAIPSPTDVKQVVDVDIKVFLDKMIEKPQFGLLPPGIRWMSKDGHSLIIEEEASYKNILLAHGPQGSNYDQKEYRLWMPRLVYGISPDASFHPFVSHLFAASKKGLNSDSSYVNKIPLPNLFKDGAVCTHTLINEHVDLPYHSLINRAISDFWGSVFNYDVGDYQISEAYNELHRRARNSGHYEGWAYWQDAPQYEIEELQMEPITRVASLKDMLLKKNHTYSFGLGEAERLMTTLVALGLENSI